MSQQKSINHKRKHCSFLEWMHYINSVYYIEVQGETITENELETIKI